MTPEHLFFGATPYQKLRQRWALHGPGLHLTDDDYCHAQYHTEDAQQNDEKSDVISIFNKRKKTKKL